jgi:hypothetical protein
MNPLSLLTREQLHEEVEECSASDPLVEWGYSRPASHGPFSRANLLPLLAASFLPPDAKALLVG